MSASVDQLPGGMLPADAGGLSAGGVSSLNLPSPAPAGDGSFPVKPPPRRPSVTETIYWPVDRGAQEALGVLGRKVFVTAGYDRCTRRVFEVFLRGGSKHGDRVDFALDALAIDISRRLQVGATLFDLLTTRALYELSEHLVGDRHQGPRFPLVLVVEAVLHRLVQIECWLVAEGA